VLDPIFITTRDVDVPRLHVAEAAVHARLCSSVSKRGTPTGTNFPTSQSRHNLPYCTVSYTKLRSDFPNRDLSVLYDECVNFSVDKSADDRRSPCFTHLPTLLAPVQAFLHTRRNCPGKSAANLYSFTNKIQLLHLGENICYWQPLCHSGLRKH
jgi:hypothetical protein